MSVQPEQLSSAEHAPSREFVTAKLGEHALAVTAKIAQSKDAPQRLSAAKRQAARVAYVNDMRALILVEKPHLASYDARESEGQWRRVALCTQLDPEMFFIENKEERDMAKLFCGVCAVQSQCLSFALENRERFGVWGGATEKEREALLRKKYVSE